MSQKQSRRQVLSVSAAAVAGMLIPVSASAAEAATPELPFLSKPLRPDAKPLLKAALDANADNSTGRLKHVLPEGSEPCFTYLPADRKVRGR